MTSTTKPTLAFFGATGGCANAVLALALKDGYKASALARTPQKLRDMLEKEHQIPASTLESNLTIIQGSALDIAPIKETLAPKGVPASLIITGLGAAPKFGAKPPFVSIDQPTLCGDASTVIVSALRELRSEGIISEAHKPIVCVVSTTGLSAKRDVPYLLTPLYHVALKIPHIDKRKQEKNYVDAATGADAVLEGFVFVRPTLLADGPSKGLSAVKAGWDKHDDAPDAVAGEAPGPALGSQIRRADVGLWIFENVVKNVGEWKGKCPSLTY